MSEVISAFFHAGPVYITATVIAAVVAAIPVTIYLVWRDR